MKDRISLIELLFFLNETRLKGYAGKGEFKKLESGFKIFKHGSRTGFSYEDKYINLSMPETFAGEEIVCFMDYPVWYMIYSGGMLPLYANDSLFVKEVTRFLRKCLVAGLRTDRDPKTDFWPRGPMMPAKIERFALFFDEEPIFLTYSCFVVEEKNIQNFHGCEIIRVNKKGDKGRDVFVHTFYGGVVDDTLFS